MNTHNIVVTGGFVEWGDYSNLRDGVCRQLVTQFRHVKAALEKQNSLVTTFGISTEKTHYTDTKRFSFK